MCCFHIYIYFPISPDILFLNLYFYFFLYDLCLKLAMVLLSIGLDIPLRDDGKGHLDIHIHSLFFKIFILSLFMKSISGLI